MAAYERPYVMENTPEGSVAHIRARGNAVLTTPMLNRGTAFTLEERAQLGLTGLLPGGVSTIEGQLRRVYAQYQRVPDNLSKNVFLSNLRDRNEVLFYRLLSDHLEEMLPIVYTPTIGTAIERFSHEYRRPRGVFLSVDAPEQVEESLLNYGLGSDEVDLIVATDSEGILGIGDQGVGGVEIAIGKLAVYTAAAGIHPRRVIPVVLDVGTDNIALLNEPMYLGNRHARVRGERYDALLDTYVTTASKLFPNAMLHWEDFGVSNARRILLKYADDYCTFNDDMQGTAAVVLAAAIAAMRATGSSLRDQRVVIHGAGTAGIGIADVMRAVMVREGLSDEEARRRFYCLDRQGLITGDRVDSVRDFQVPYAHPAADVDGWSRTPQGGIRLAEVVAQARPTMLIGTSTQTGAFTEEIVRGMVSWVDRPIIMPLSNPTSRCEALPEDVLRWTDGRALVATGSPFPPVTLDGQTYSIGQANNALVFPGLGLGVIVSRARRVSDGMLAAAANAVAEMSDAGAPGAPLLPSVQDLRTVSAAVAEAVAATAEREGLAQVTLDNPVQQIYEAMWQPAYPRVDPV
ncbi:MAG TPA: NAD-dependent malic enzyme [Acidothermales bacterium]